MFESIDTLGDWDSGEDASVQKKWGFDLRVRE